MPKRELIRLHVLTLAIHPANIKSKPLITFNSIFLFPALHCNSSSSGATTSERVYIV